MTLNYLVLITALIISGVAAYYSIVGLTAIFAAAFWPIVIMGSVLELGKIVTSVWLKTYWLRVSWQLKTYLTSAVAILMLITSLGIFGFLSRAHLEQGVPTADVAARVSILDDAIAVQRENIAAARAALTQLNEQVNQRLSRGTTEQGAERAVQIRRQQAAERNKLQAEIAQAQKTLASLTAERAPVASELRKVESEVGPIKYVAAVIYGDDPDAKLLERAVRWVIIIIVLVFDPLAIALLLAANSGMRWEKIKRMSDDPSPEPLVSENVPSTDQIPPPATEVSVPEELMPATAASNNKFDWSKHVYLTRPFAQLKNGRPLAAPVQQTESSEPIIDAQENTVVDQQTDPEIAEEINDKLWDHDDFQGITAGNRVSFGTQFPNQPEKNEIFLRVDYLPSRLFKFNGKKWVTVNKEMSEKWLYDDKYIDQLIEQLSLENISLDDLTALEQDRIAKRLKSKITYEK
jgi:cell division protein FtsB